VIGLDTNVLVRYFVKDDPEQTRLAVGLVYSLTPKEPGWVGIAAILELVWVMSRIYRVGRAQIAGILDTLLASKDIVVEQGDIAREALQRYRSGKAEFADCLVAASAKAAACTRTVTFDRIAARDAGMEILE
jgi:predicted nucleic-acid-binding protein